MYAPINVTKRKVRHFAGNGRRILRQRPGHTNLIQGWGDTKSTHLHPKILKNISMKLLAICQLHYNSLILPLMILQYVYD